MSPQYLFNIIKANPQFDEFIRNTEDFELLIKELDQDEIKRLSTEYPELLKSKKKIKDNEKHAVSKSMISLTFIKINHEVKNYSKLKKFKIYLDKTKEQILKILKN